MDYFKEFERFWDADKAGGTCLHPVHNKVTIDALRFDIGLGMERDIVASVSFGKAGVSAERAILNRNNYYYGQFIHSTFGRYLIGKNVSYPFRSSLWNNVKDALFRIVFTDIGEKVDAVQFATFEDLYNFIHSKMVDEKSRLFKSGVYVEAYWIVDNNMSWLHKTMGANRLFASMRGNLKGSGSKYNKCREASLGYNINKRHAWDTFMGVIWNGLYGSSLPSGTRLRRSNMFWLPSNATRRKKVYARNNGYTFRSNSSNTRTYFNTSSNNIEYFASGSGLVLSDFSLFYLDWDNLNGWSISRYTRYFNPGGNVSYIEAHQVEINSGAGNAVYIKPWGIDVVYTNWFDANIYEIQVQVKGVDYANHTYNITDPDIYNTMKEHKTTGLVIPLNKIMARFGYTGIDTIDILPELKLRLHKKGTPYVSRASKGTLKTLGGKKSMFYIMD